MSATASSDAVTRRQVAQLLNLHPDSVTRNLPIRGPDKQAIAERLCGRGISWRDRATLRIIVVDSASGQLAAGMRLRVVAQGSAARVDTLATGDTDATGAVVFCNVPAGRRVTVVDDQERAVVSDFVPSRGEIAARIVRLPRRHDIPEVERAQVPGSLWHP